jgi:hypothetical protein
MGVWVCVGGCMWVCLLPRRGRRQANETTNSCPKRRCKGRVYRLPHVRPPSRNAKAASGGAVRRVVVVGSGACRGCAGARVMQWRRRCVDRLKGQNAASRRELQGIPGNPGQSWTSWTSWAILGKSKCTPSRVESRRARPERGAGARADGARDCTGKSCRSGKSYVERGTQSTLESHARKERRTQSCAVGTSSEPAPSRRLTCQFAPRTCCSNTSHPLSPLGQRLCTVTGPCLHADAAAPLPKTLLFILQQGPAPSTLDPLD